MFTIVVKKVIILLIAGLLVSGCLGKDHLPQPTSGDFTGVIKDKVSDAGIPGVKVTLGETFTAVADCAGRFSLENLAPGEYQAVFKQDWYEDLSCSYRHLGKAGEVEFIMRNKPLEGGIIYSSNEGGEAKREIYYLDLTNRTVSKIYGVAGSSENHPAKLTGTQIIFQSDCNGGQNDLFIYDLQTKAMETICVSPADEEHPTADVAGAKIAFQSLRNGSRQVFLYDRRVGTEPRLVANGQNPAISPDGNQIAYVDGSYHLWIYDDNLKTSRKVDHSYKFNNPCWNPAGTAVAVEAWAETEKRRIYLINDPYNSDLLRQVTYDYATSDKHTHPCWSGDGEIIYFTANICYSSRIDIYGIKIDGDTPAPLEKAELIMVSRDSGNKDYPAWGEL